MSGKETGRTRGGFKASRHGTGSKAGPRASAAGNKSAQKKAAEHREAKSPKVGTKAVSPFLRGKRIEPRKIDGRETVVQLVEGTFQSYNSGRLREACALFTELMLDKQVTVGMTLTGALTPAGLGMSTIIPLMEAGFVDWIISTGANLYHDTHFGLGLSMHRGNPQASDTVLREEGVVRIYDVFFDYDVLLSTDAFFRKIIRAPEFQRTMSSAEFHHLCGKYLVEREKALGIPQKSLLAAAYRCGVPIYTSSPGDSSIGMNIAALALEGGTCVIDPNRDVNETASIVLHAKRTGGQSAVLIAGGGSPKNFALQTEPQIQEVLGIDEKGHDYFLQITDARPDTGGLSGATPAEAVSWGKIDPDKLPDAVVCYLDSTIALPILTSYALAKRKPRKLKRLYDQRGKMMQTLVREFEKANG
jgi:deoxyhypusine synthase